MRYLIVVLVLATVVIWDATYKNGTYLRAIVGGVTKITHYVVD